MASDWTVGPRLSAAGGVEVGGADLSRPMPGDLQEAIRAAFLEHHIVVFPGQSLSREQQFAFCAGLGEVETHRSKNGEPKRHGVAHVLSNLDAQGNPVARFSPAANYHWHTDKPYHPAPPMLTALYAVELPPSGGDTQFANTAAAYAALPDDMKRRIAGLRVAFRPKFDEASPAVDHPLVRTHPDTGRKALYLGNHAVGIVAMAESEGMALLEALLAHVTQPDFVYTHKWQKGELVIWDNRCLLHRGLANYEMTRHRRVLHRNVVRGTVPV